MPVTFTVASHPAEEYSMPNVRNDSATAMLRMACSDQYAQCQEMLQTSFALEDLPALVPQGNGFVQAVLTAYKQHHHLRIRYVTLHLCSD